MFDTLKCSDRVGQNTITKSVCACAVFDTVKRSDLILTVRHDSITIISVCVPVLCLTLSSVLIQLVNIATIANSECVCLCCV